jgi:glutathione S-transferase
VSSIRVEWFLPWYWRTARPSVKYREGIRNAAPGLKERAIAGAHDYEQIPELVERSKLRVKNFLADLDARLTEVPFVAGEHYSIADITAVVTVDFAAKAINVLLRNGHTALRRWYELVSKRPSASANYYADSERPNHGDDSADDDSASIDDDTDFVYGAGIAARMPSGLMGR